MSSLLTTKEKERLAKVRSIMSSDGNPYTKDNLNKLTIGTSVHIRTNAPTPTDTEVIRVRKAERKSLLVGTDGKVVDPKRFPKLTTSTTGYRCVICGGDTEFTTSTKVKYKSGLTKLAKFSYVLPEGYPYTIHEY